MRREIVGEGGVTRIGQAAGGVEAGEIGGRRLVQRPDPMMADGDEEQQRQDLESQQQTEGDRQATRGVPRLSISDAEPPV